MKISRYVGCLVLMLLSGCVSTDSWPEMSSRKRWLGKTAQDFIAVHGEPNGARNEVDGRVTYYWESGYTTQEEVPLGGTTQQVGAQEYETTLYYDTETRSHTCVLSITTRDGLIIGYEQERSSSAACNAYNQR